MSVLLRVLLMITGLVTALFVARDAVNFDLIQTWMAILIVFLLLGVGGVWALRRKT